MKISNRVKRNISFAILLLGIVCIIARAWEIFMDPSSGRAWFDLFSITFLTCFCFGRFRELQKLVNEGVKFGTK